jgi:hypothetical protein
MGDLNADWGGKVTMYVVEVALDIAEIAAG